MASTALHSRASISSSEHSGESRHLTSNTTTASSTISDKRPRRQKEITDDHFSGRSSDRSTISDSSPSPTSSSNHLPSSHDPSRHRHSHQASKSKANGSSQRNSSRALHDPHFFPNSTASSGFSSAMSDTSAHSTSGTSSPYGTGVTSGVFSTHRLSPADIKYRDERPKVLRSYIMGKLIGEGSYGKVKEGIDSKTKKMVAIKILSKKTLRRVPGGEASIEREIGIIESLHHKHIVTIHTHFPVEAKQKFYIVFEYLGGGTLTGLLESAPGKRLPLHQARKMFLHLLSGLEHLRERRVLHRDIKPDNLLLASSGELKIADFGVAEIVSTDPSEKVGDHSGIGSPAFQAPELIASPSASASNLHKKSKRAAIDLIFKSDIWSAGIVLFIMVVGEYPFPIQGNIMLLFEDIAAGKFDVPDWVDPDCADLIKQMLQTNPVERIDLPAIRSHPFVKNTPSKSAPSVPIPSSTSMWPHHDRNALGSVIKKMKPQLERQEERERAARFDDFDDQDLDNHDDEDDSAAMDTANESGSSRPRASTSKCIVM